MLPRLGVVPRRISTIVALQPLLSLWLALHGGALPAWAELGVGNGTNTIVRFEIRRGTNALGRLDVELLDHEKPETVRNFLLYVRSGAYSNTFLHRCVPDFVVQGGGFSVTNSHSAERFSGYLQTTNYGRVPNEFLSGARIANTLGTLAMAKTPNDPDSATSQWFFNLGDNSAALDGQNGGFTVFGRVLDSNNPNEGLSVLEHFNSLSTNAGVVDLGKLLGSSYQVFNSLPVSYTNSVTRVPVYRELYYVEITVLGETAQVGQSAPGLNLLSPGPYSSFTNGMVTVQGTASDDVEVARVVYRVENGPLEIAQGTTNWEVTFSPKQGFNTVTVESIDWDGNRSASASVQFYYAVAIPLNLRVVGSGWVSGLANGKLLTPGASYTGTAVPGANYIFEGWKGSVTSTAPTISFEVPADATNFNLEARFIADPLPLLGGTYHGLIQSLGATPSLDATGFVSLSLGADGAFTGSILYHGGIYYFTGEFDASGNAAVSGVLDGVNRVISLRLQKTNKSGLITGSLSGTSSFVQLERLAASVGAGSSSPPLGKYTFVIPAVSSSPDPLIPGGHGVGTATLLYSGTLALSGTLGDGTTFSAAPSLTRSGRWPVFVGLAGGKGALLGWVAYRKDQPRSLEGGLQWVRAANGALSRYPGGFSNQVAFAGSAYSAPSNGPRLANWAYGVARLNGTDVVPGISNVVKLSKDNTLTVLDPVAGALTLNLDVLSGRVSGSFVHPWFQTTSQIKGVLLRGSNIIRGQYVNGAQVGSLSIDAAPFLVPQLLSSTSLPALTEGLADGGILRFPADGTIELSEPLTPELNTLLDANGHSVVISGGGATRLVEVQTNRVFSAVGVSFVSGFNPGWHGNDGTPAESGGEAMGAGILNLGGIVTLTNCLVTNCVVVGGDAGVDAFANGTTAPGGTAFGAAICNLGGHVTLQTTTIADNRATAGKGGVLSGTGLTARTSGAALGAGIFSDNGECRVFGSAFLRNFVEGGEPRLLASGEYGYAGDAAGGALAIAGGSLRFIDSKCLTNRAAGATVPSSVAGFGNSFGGAILIETNVTAVIEQATLAGNSAIAGQFEGTLQAPSAQGGAIFNAGALTLRSSSLENNAATGGSSRPGGPGFGGAVVSLGPLVVNSSTFNDNIARGGDYAGTPTNAVPGAAAAGGAIYASLGTVTITNSTFVSNRAVGGSGAQPVGGSSAPAGPVHGGALATASNITSLAHVTLSSNEANGEGPFGSALANVYGIVRLRSSILTSNWPANLFGGVNDFGYNLSSDASFPLAGSGSLTNVQLSLGPLSANGGPTRTMAIPAQSPARDAVRGSYPLVDQRGTNRPQGTYADSGAFEFVQTLPVFTLQPSGTNTVQPGSNFSLQSQANGPGTIGYFWLKNDAPVASATNKVLSLVSIQFSDAGNYAVVATNSFGAVTSSVATIIVDARPFIVTQPSDLILVPGVSTSLVVVATGPELGFTWLHNNSPIPGATSPTLPIVDAGAGAQGTYQVIVTNYGGTATSRLANVNFSSSALSILNPPQDTIVGEGDAASLSVLVSGIMPIGYQWLRGSVLLPDATNATLSFASASKTNTGTYRVIATNAYLSVTSAPAALTVVGSPSLSVRLEGTNILISCFGDAGRSHRLLQATNFVSNSTWTPVATNVIPGNGSITWTRPAPANGLPAALYFRAVTP